MPENKSDSTMQITITDINNLGCGVGHTGDGKTVFVNGAVSGDTVLVKVIKDNKSFLVGKLLEIVERSKDRIYDNICTAPLSCGGCVYRCITYEREKVLKGDYVKTAFRKSGLSDIPISAVHSTNETEHYRNKAQYPVCIQKGRVAAGFFAVKSHNVIVADSCLLQPVVFTEIVKYVCDFATENKFTVYNEENGRGLLRHIFLREGKATGEILLCLVINGDTIPDSENFSEEIRAKFPSIVGIQLNINKKNTNLILGKESSTLWGRGYFEDVLCGVKLHISAGAFYQVNHDATELLYKKAAEVASLEPTDTLLDLYCGIGSIGLSMADKVKEVIGIEIVEEAVACAKENAKLNNIKNASFYCGDATDIENLLKTAETQRAEKISADIVVLDPPRKGIEKALATFIAERKIPRVVYVSCNPDTLARDCVYFTELGYKIESVTPVDMFPRTGHVECVVLMSRVK